MKSALLAISLLLLASAAHAIEIETTYWGDVWQRRGSMPSAVLPGETPGSGSNDTLRVTKPWAWAFLDGYDVRAAKCLDLAPVLSHTNISYRMTWLSPFFARRDLLRKLWCGENHDVYWGGSVLDDYLAMTNYPTAANFDWMANPTSNVWKNGGSAWFPTYRSLFPSIAFPLEYTPTLDGLAPRLFAGVNVSEQANADGSTNTFSRYISFRPGSHEISNTAYATPFPFDDILTNATLFTHKGYDFTPETNITYHVVTNVIGGVTNIVTVAETNITQRADYTDQAKSFVTNLYKVATRRTARLDYDTISLPIQTLACFDRLYRFAPDLVAITNCYSGSAEVYYNMLGYPDLSVTTTGYGADVTIAPTPYGPYFNVDGIASNVYALATNACAFTAPRARVGNTFTYGSGYAPSTNGNYSIYFPDQDEYSPRGQDILAAIRRSGGGKYYLELTTAGSATLFKYTNDTEVATELTNEMYGVSTLFKDGTYKITPKATVGFKCYFSQADEIALQSPSSVRWFWPSNTTFNATGSGATPFSAAFAMSYCAATNGSPSFTDNIGVDVKYDGSQSLWNCRDGYGYAFTRNDYALPSYYPTHLSLRLDGLHDRSREYIGGDLTDKDYVLTIIGANQQGAVSFADTYMSGLWEGRVAISTAESNRLVVASVTTNFPTVVTNITTHTYVAYHSQTNSRINYVESNDVYRLVREQEGWRIVREFDYCDTWTRDWASYPIDLVAAYTNIDITANGNLCYILTNALAYATNITRTVAHFDPNNPRYELPDIYIGTITTNVVGGVTNVIYRHGDFLQVIVLTNGVPAEYGEEWDGTAYYIYDAISTNDFTEIARTATEYSETLHDWREFITVTTNSAHTVTDRRAYFTATVEDGKVTIDPPNVFLFGAGLSIGVRPRTNATPWRVGKAIDTRVKALQSANFLFPQNHRKE